MKFKIILERILIYNNYFDVLIISCYNWKQMFLKKILIYKIEVLYR